MIHLLFYAPIDRTLNNSEASKFIETALHKVLSPPTLLTPPLPAQVVNFNRYKNKLEQSRVIESWSLRGGIGLVSYDTYRILTSVKGKRSARQCERLKTWLRDPGE